MSAAFAHDDLIGRSGDGDALASAFARAALIAYCLTAMGFHARASDRLLRYAPAAAMLAWSIAALRFYRVEQT